MGPDEWKFAITNVGQEVGFANECDLYSDSVYRDRIRMIYFLIPDEDYHNDEANPPRTPEHVINEFKKIFAENGVNIMPAHGYAPTFATKSTRARPDDCLDLTSSTIFEKPPGSRNIPAARSRNDHNSTLTLTKIPSRVALDHLALCDYGCRPWIEGR